MTITLAYAITGIIDLINGSDPIINENIIKEYYASIEGDGTNIKEANLMFAVALVNKDKEPFFD